MRLDFFIGRYTTIKEQHQLNLEIRDKEIRLIGEDGSQLGIVTSEYAMKLAAEGNFDLVKISPTATPPVCKIMNYGKYKFELAKKEKEARKNQKIVELKEVWLSMTIDTNDLNVKAKQAEKFIKNGDKVKVSIKMRGRQNAHSSLGLEVMDKFFQILKDISVQERRPMLDGKNILMILTPIKN